MCRPYQNCASRRDWHGHGTQAVQRGAAQLIRVFPSGVLSSTGRCVTGRWGWASLVACMSSLLLSRRSQACWSCFPAGGIHTAPLHQWDHFCAPAWPPATMARPHHPGIEHARAVCSPSVTNLPGRNQLLPGESALRSGKSSSQPPDARHPALASELAE